MSEVKVVWSASEKTRTQELVATGDKPDTTRTFTIDLTELTAEERQAIVVHLGVDRIGYAKIDMQDTVKFDAEYYGDGLRRNTLYYDAQPTIQQVIEWIVHDRAERAESKAHLSFIAAEEKAETDRKAALYNEYRPQVEALIEATDYNGLGKFTLTDLGNWSPSRAADGLSTLIREARQEIKAAIAKADKVTWIATHGSDRLQRGCSAGHDCQRLYVLERAALEAPDFTLDFNDSANWKDRSCPTTEALDAADEARATADALSLCSPAIVWLTSPPSYKVPSSSYGDYEEWEDCEAVVIRSYLGKYDLVKII